MKINLNKKGTVLLLALLVMAGVVTVSLGTANLIISEVKQSLQLDQAIIAFYAADSGVERGLYQSRKQNFDVTLFNQITSTFDNNASYQLIAADTEDVLYTTLLEDESYQVDLYDPHSLTLLENPIKSIGLSWSGTTSWLEIAWACWGQIGNLGETKSAYYSQGESPVYLNLYSASNCSLYRVRIIARHGAANNIQVRAYSELDPLASCGNPPTSCQVPLPARVQIKGLGQYPANSDQASRQAILVTMPERSPLYGLYDYVVYSEEEIKKEN